MVDPDSKFPNRKEVLAQVDRILESPIFSRSKRSSDFLRFIVDETLDGRASGLNQLSIATNALGRKKDFNPGEDPAVRIQAARVRQALLNFYLEEGVGDRVIISMPKGPYRPVFRYKADTQRVGTGQLGKVEPPWPSLLLNPLTNLNIGDGLDYLPDGMMYDLATELDRYPGLRVFVSQKPSPASGSESAVTADIAIDFELIGKVDRIGDLLRFAFHLLHRDSREQIWAQEYRCIPGGSGITTVREELPRRIAATLAEEHGAIQGHVKDTMLGKHSGCEDAYQAILLGYHFEHTTSPEVFSKALEALSQAVVTHPDCGLAWSVLSRLWSAYFAHEWTGKPEGIEQALECARKGAELRPFDLSTQAPLAYALLLADQVEECQRTIESAYERNPHTLFFLDTVGYLLTVTGDWDRGSELSRKATELNPFPHQIAYTGLWYDAIRREDFETALFEANRFSVEGTFWKPLMRLVARVLGGNSKDRSIPTEAAELLALKPSFESDGRRLIRKYVKFPDLQNRIEEGLAGAGIRLRKTV